MFDTKKQKQQWPIHCVPGFYCFGFVWGGGRGRGGEGVGSHANDPFLFPR